MVMVDVAAPAAGGSNVTGKIQFPPLAARFVPAKQSRLLGTMVKPLGFVPEALGNGLNVTLVRVMAWLPVLVTVVVIEPLVVLIS